MLTPFLPVDVYVSNGPVTDSVNVSNQDQELRVEGDRPSPCLWHTDSLSLQVSKHGA